MHIILDLQCRNEKLFQYFLRRSKQVLNIARLHQPPSSQDFTRFHQTLQMMKAVSQPLNYLHRLVQPQREIKPRQKEVVLAMVSKILFNDNFEAILLAEIIICCQYTYSILAQDSSSSQQKKLRRKKRGEQRLAGSNNKNGKNGGDVDSSDNEVPDQE